MVVGAMKGKWKQQYVESRRVKKIRKKLKTKQFFLNKKNKINNK